MEKEEKNKKNYISIIIIIIGIIILSIFIKGIINYQDKEDNNDINNQATFNKEKISFTCELVDPEEKENNYPTYTPNSYGVGDYVYCIINNYSNFKPTELNIFYYNEDNKNIDLVSVKSLTEDWKIELKSEEKYSDISLTPASDNLDLKNIIFKFYIKNNDNITDNKYQINISKIELKRNNEKYEIYDKNIELTTGKNYRLKITKDKVESYKLLNKSYEKINEITCKECHIYVPQSFIYEDYKNGKVVINNDTNSIILYDMNKGILGTYGSINWLYSKNDPHENGTYLYVGNKDNTKYGIIDKDGNLIKDYVLEKSCYGNQTPRDCLSYSIEDNLLVNKKDNKYGIIKIISDDIVIDYKYDDVKLINSKYFKVKENDKWYIYNYSNKTKQIEEGFDIIYELTDNVLIVPKNGYWQFINYNNTSINSIKIDEEYKYIYYYPDSKEPNIIHININNDEYGTIKESYDYNINDNTLKKVEK